MAEGEEQLRTDERGGHGRVDVAADQNQIGPVPTQHWLQAHHHFRRLHSMRAGANRQVDVRGRHLELLEEHRRHRRIVVLPGVHECLPKIRVLRSRQ